MIRNPHRAFEEHVAAWESISYSGNFSSDFVAMIKYCIVNGNVEHYHRKNFDMADEPYGINVSHIVDLEEKTAILVDHALSVIEPATQHWQWLYEKLNDLDSRMLLLTIIAYRSIGWRYVRMPLDSHAFWNCMKRLSELESYSQPVSDHYLADIIAGRLKIINLDKFGIEIKLLSEAFGVFNEFIYSQYSYRGRNDIIGPKEGDYVFDCGACFGGTSLHFAERVGKSGRVISYEFFPENVDILSYNLKINPDLEKLITVVEKPVWSQSGITMHIEGSGPATQVFVGENATGREKRTDYREFQSTTIDDTVFCLDLQRVDFIKMDIEGSEMMALRGAVDTIKKERPTLAISVYHKLFDFYEIPQFIDGLDLGYKFYLQHSTVHGDETVIFASVKN